MLNCKQATELVSHSLDRRLPFGQKIELKLHLMMCRLCRNYAKQLWHIRRISPRMDSHIENQTQHTLSHESKARIRKKMLQ